MEGLNKAFMKSVETFMLKFPIDITSGHSLSLGLGDNSGRGKFETLAPGIYEFDLKRAADGRVLLHHFPDRGKKVGIFTHKIRAYWLPWKANATTSLQLANGAPYFFTSALGGCRIEIGPGANPLVLHVSGGTQQKWRDAEARKHLGNDAGARRLSYTKHYNASELAFLAGYWHKDLKAWRFVAQGIGINPEAKTYHVVRLSQHVDGSIVLL